MKKVFIFTLVFLLFAGTVHGGEFKLKKNPFFAGSLSWYYPGMGQVYNGEFLKGGLFATAEYLLLYFAINRVSDISFKLQEGIIVNENPVITQGDRNISIGLFTLTGILHIYNIYDSINGSLKHNLKYSDRLKGERINPVFLAGFSFMMPGTGQMFNGEVKKGSELVFYNLVLKLWKIHIDWDLRKRYEPSVNAINWNDLNSNDRITLFSFYAIDILFRFYSAYDAYTGGSRKLDIEFRTDSRNNSLLLLGMDF